MSAAASSLSPFTHDNINRFQWARQFAVRSSVGQCSASLTDMRRSIGHHHDSAEFYSSTTGGEHRSEGRPHRGSQREIEPVCFNVAIEVQNADGRPDVRQVPDLPPKTDAN